LHRAFSPVTPSAKHCLLYTVYCILIMWCFILKQDDLKPDTYRALQKKATLTEVEVFNEPHPNRCLFIVDAYAPFVDTLDLLGLTYELRSHRPTREELVRGEG
jgi:hypothetical protein